MKKRNIAVIGDSAKSLSVLKELFGELQADFPSGRAIFRNGDKKRQQTLNKGRNRVLCLQ
jgi:hypothetical protein